jgi:hypothetical protein
MRRELLGEVERAIAERTAKVVPTVPDGVEDPFAGIPTKA